MNIGLHQKSAMRRPRKIFMMALLCIFAAASALTPQTQAKNILEYYLTLPEDYFKCELSPAITREFREKAIVRKNIKNGYILAKSEGHRMEAALFTDNHLKISIVAVNISCGAGCMCSRFALLRPADGKWHDETDKIFPGREEIIKAAGGRISDTYYFVLPEIGTDIKVIDDDSGSEALNIRWSGGTFVIREPATK